MWGFGGGALSSQCSSQVISAGLSKTQGRKCHYDGTKADVWSLGVLLFLMLTNELPISVNFKACRHDTSSPPLSAPPSLADAAQTRAHVPPSFP